MLVLISCTRTGKSKGKRKALESDDDDEIIEQVPKPTKKPAAPKPAASKPKPKRAASPTTEDKPAGEGEVVRNAEGKVRKTRRVVRSEMVMNKRGYMGSLFILLLVFVRPLGKG